MIATAWMWLAVGATALGGLLSALQLSLKAMTGASLEELAQLKRNDAGARRIEHVLDDVDGHDLATALPRILCHLVVACGVVMWVTELRGAQTPAMVELLIGLAGAAMVVWLFGSVVPHAIANHAAEGTVYRWSRLIRGMYIAMRPVRRLALFVDEVVRRLVGSTPKSRAESLEEELLLVVEEGEREGRIDEAERDMIEAVVDFRNTTVEQIMTPRTEIEAIELTDDFEVVKEFIRSEGHSRIPVFEENLDHIVGILYVKDLLIWMVGSGNGSPGAQFDLRSILRPVNFVPETKTVRELLAELLAKKVHIALAADEYGGTSGLVTIEDIVEEVFGEIWDEYEQAEPGGPDVQIDVERQRAIIDARTHIDDANDVLEELGVELPESAEYDTVGGFVVTTLGRIPEIGEQFDQGTIRVVVLEAQPTRVLRVQLDVLGEGTEPTEPKEPVQNSRSALPTDADCADAD